IRKELSVKPGHASDFFGSVLGTRLGIGLLVFAAMYGVMVVTHRPPQVQLLVMVFGPAQLILISNQSLAAMLHASGTVDGLSLLNIISKAIWGGGILLTVYGKYSLVGIAVSLL